MAEGVPTTSEVVSSDDEALILVDRDDREIGRLDKAACHDGAGVLHRAFSLFVFNRRGEVLLQRRSAAKRLWPLFWSNSCCSHPRYGEPMDAATRRRLDEELGLTTELRHLFTFSYHATYLDLGAEREVCWVFAGTTGQEPRFNTNEIAEVRWIGPDDLDRELAARPELFTPWFALEWPRVRSRLSEILAATAGAESAG